MKTHRVALETGGGVQDDFLLPINSCTTQPVTPSGAVMATKGSRLIRANDDALVASEASALKGEFICVLFTAPSLIAIKLDLD